MNNSSGRRLKENEIIFQLANQTVAEFVTEESGGKDPVVRFYCECSNLECRGRIPLRASDYNKFHKNKRHFIVLEGHEMAEIEKVVSKQDGFCVVEKDGELPSDTDIAKNLSNIADGL
jgi:hypothetical protein